MAELVGDLLTDNTHFFGEEQSLCLFLSKKYAVNKHPRLICADCSRTAQQHAVAAGCNYALTADENRDMPSARYDPLVVLRLNLGWSPSCERLDNQAQLAL